MEAGSVEASVAEKPHVREIHRRIKGAIREPCQSLEHGSAQRERRGKDGAGKIDIRQQRTFQLERLVDAQPAEVFNFTPPQRLHKPGPDAHVLPAAPAGGPAKLSANAPMAVISTRRVAAPLPTMRHRAPPRNPRCGRRAVGQRERRGELGKVGSVQVGVMAAPGTASWMLRITP